MNLKQINDLNLSAYLSIQGHKLIKVEGERYRAYFYFESTPQLEEDILRFYNRQTSVDALTYGETLRHFKALALSKK